MNEQSVFESIGDGNIVFTTGKGGVGKSTISACLCHKFSNDAERVVGIDMDAAHSLADSFGHDRGKTPEGTSHFQENDDLILYFLGKVIPDFFKGETIQGLLLNGIDFNELNTHLDALVDQPESFLPFMRLGMHDNFVALSKAHDALAYIIQIIDLLEKNILYRISGTDISKDIQSESFDRVIIDSENTNNLMKVLKSLISVRTTILNLNKAFHGGTIEKLAGTVTRTAVKGQENLSKFANSEIIGNPKLYIDQSVSFIRSIVGSKIIVVTSPGYTEINQAIEEIKFLVSLGIPPSHVVINKYRFHYNNDKDATEAACNELSSVLDEYGVPISKADSDFRLTNPGAPEDEKRGIARENLELLARTI